MGAAGLIPRQPLVCSFLLRITPALTLSISQAASPLQTKDHITPKSCLLYLLPVVNFDAGLSKLEGAR